MEECTVKSSKMLQEYNDCDIEATENGRLVELQRSGQEVALVDPELNLGEIDHDPYNSQRSFLGHSQRESNKMQEDNEIQAEQQQLQSSSIKQNSDKEDLRPESSGLLLQVSNSPNQNTSQPGKLSNQKAAPLGFTGLWWNTAQLLKNTQEYKDVLMKKNAVFEIKGTKYLFSKTSLNCLTQKSKLRIFCVKMIVNTWFDRFIILCIMANTFLLASKEYQEKYDVSYDSEWNKILDNLDLCFSVIYMIEFLLKVTAMGFIRHKEAYLSDAWNWIDFFIILVSIIGFTPMSNDSSLKGFRSMRVLRPLRSMNQLQSMRSLLNTFFSSIPSLINVCIFLVFIVSIFSIAAVNFFSGAQYQFCRQTEKIIDDGVNNPYWPINTDAKFQCSSNEMCSGYPNNLDADSVAVCGDIYREYDLDPVKYDDAYNNEMINYDITNFNSVLASSLTIFQVITLEGWSKLMYNYQDTVSELLSSIFFVGVIIIGAFTTLNLVLASIMHSYLEQERKQQNEVVKDQSTEAFSFKRKKSSVRPRKKVEKKNSKQIISLETQPLETQPLDQQLSEQNLPTIEKNVTRMPELEPRVKRKKIIDHILTDSQNASCSFKLGFKEIESNQEAPSFEKNDPEQSRSKLLPRIENKSIERIKGAKTQKNLEDKIAINRNIVDSEEYVLRDSSSNFNKNPEEKHKAKKNEMNHQFLQEETKKQFATLENSDKDNQSLYVPDDRLNQSAELSKSSPFQQTQQISQKQKIAQKQKTPHISINVEPLANIDIKEEDQDIVEFNAEQRAKKNCCYYFFYEIVISVTFNFLIYCFILANTIALALYRYDQSDRQARILAILNDVFVFVFTAEMIAKIIGLGIKNYALDKFNLFDCLIVVVSLLDFALLNSQIDLVEKYDGIISAFRALRLLRVVKLARHWHAFQEIFRTMIQSVIDIANFSLLLLLCLFIFALLGMELFAYSVYEDINGELVFGQENIQEAFKQGDKLTWPRQNFNNIFNAMLSVFIVIVGEDWNVYMYLYVRALGHGSETWRNIAILYFILLFLIGNTILLALFTALLLKNQEEDENKDALEENMNSYQRQASAEQLPFCSRKGCNLRFQAFADSFVRAFGGDSALQRRIKLRQAKNPRGNASPSSGNEINQKPTWNNKVQVEIEKNDEPFIEEQLSSIQNSQHSDSKASNQSLQSCQSVKKLRVTDLQRPYALLHYDFDQEILKRGHHGMKNLHKSPTGRSCYLFASDNRLRLLCYEISSHIWFEIFIIVLIFGCTITLAFEHPLENPKSKKSDILFYIDVVFTCIFGFEAILKIITSGFWLNGKQSYIRDSWNILDFSVVVLSVLGLLINSDTQIVKVIRIARIVRPLRLINHLEGLKIATVAFFKSFPQMMRLQIVVIFQIIMISILLTSLLSGKLFQCDLNHTPLSFSQSSFVSNKWECLNYGGEWVIPPLNFDNTLQGIVTLFIFQTREGWINIMENSVDAVDVDFVGERNRNVFLVVLYIALVVIIQLLFVNMVVRIVIETYNEQKDYVSFNRLLSPQQRSWIEVQIMTYAAKPKVKLQSDSYSSLRNCCIKIQINPNFDKFIMICILLNTCVLALVWFDQPQVVLPLLTEILNYVFLMIFTMEAIIKLIALKTLYFRDSWNIFDFTIVSITLIILLLQMLNIEVPFGRGPTILRALRIGRILRLMKRQQQLKIIFHTLLESAGSLSSLGLLLIIMFFIFAIIGRFLFGLTQINEPMVELNEHVNFRDFSASFLLLFRCSTGESWHMIMFDYARQYSPQYQCRENEDYESMIKYGGPKACGSVLYSYAYFLTFNTLVFQIFINLFVAIIIDAFLGQSNQFQLPIQNYSIEEFTDIWAEFDPLATGYISITDLEQLIIQLAKSSEGRKLIILPERMLVSEITRRRYMALLKIPMYSQMSKVMFYDVLQQLCDKINLKNFRQIKKGDEGPISSAVFKGLGIKGVQGEFERIMNAEDKNAINFAETVRQMGQLNPKITLMIELQKGSKYVNEKYAVYVDSDKSIDKTSKQRRSIKVQNLRTSLVVSRQNQSDINVLTTKHYFAGMVLQKHLKTAIQRFKNRREKGIKIKRELNSRTKKSQSFNNSLLGLPDKKISTKKGEIYNGASISTTIGQKMRTPDLNSIENQQSTATNK